MGYIDSDSHVIEGMETWEYLTGDERAYRPRIAELDTAVAMSSLGQVTSSAPHAKIWLVGDTWCSFFRADGNTRGNANVYEPGATQLSDPALRIADLDALGIDAQLLISSFWLGAEIPHQPTEIALCRSYNRWMADSVAGHADRLPWTTRVPLHDLSAAATQLEFAKEHGAACVLLRGIEHGYHLSDPYFYPLYEKAQDLGLSMLVHLGEPNRNLVNQTIGRMFIHPAAYMMHLHSLMAGFHSVMATELPKRFPRLKWGFVEGGASWVPTVLQQHARLVASGRDFLNVTPIRPETLSEANIFVACETDEDLPYLLDIVGEDNLIIGTDYGHNDIGTELAAHLEIMTRSDISEAAKRKIVESNGRRFLGIPDSFRPTARPESLVAPPNVRGASTPDGRPILSISHR